MMYTVYAVMLNALSYTFILYHILFLIICDAFMCVHCIVFYSSATEALINNNNNNNRGLNACAISRQHRFKAFTLYSLFETRSRCCCPILKVCGRIHTTVPSAG